MAGTLDHHPRRADSFSEVVANGVESWVMPEIQRTPNDTARDGG
jgi:hypothetical protein